MNIIQKNLFKSMIKFKNSSLISFLLSEVFLSMIFYSYDGFLSGLDAIIVVSLGLVLTLYLDWLTKKDEYDLD